METARGGRVDFALILAQIIRQVRQHFVAHVRSVSGVLAEQADRFTDRESRRRKDRKMADQDDDLGIPRNFLRPAGENTAAPRFANLPGFVAEPAHAAISARERADQSVDSRDNEVEARTLIIGEEISLSGEINSCDRLIVEGRIEANLANCHHITIAETGIFNGKAAIDDADIRGRFEGKLIVRKRLMIRATGSVSGTITYGDIEIEAGGRISGAIQAHERPNGLETLNHPQSAMVRPRVGDSEQATDTAPSTGEV